MSVGDALSEGSRGPDSGAEGSSIVPQSGNLHRSGRQGNMAHSSEKARAGADKAKAAAAREADTAKAAGARTREQLEADTAAAPAAR